jgi:phosphoglycerate dehydrogenase-like enzyme
VNCSRGPVIKEDDLVEHLRVNPMFRVGLDVFEVTSLFSVHRK